MLPLEGLPSCLLPPLLSPSLVPPHRTRAFALPERFGRCSGCCRCCRPVYVWDDDGDGEREGEEVDKGEEEEEVSCVVSGMPF